jgi:nitroimidazol reductase NimA-like FMN-containing flavoprotein (pyridoxamine 5'-phosphate oxidase superfamily)
MSAPQASRPKLPASYGVPVSPEGLLSWSWVTQRLEEARQYWLATTRPDGRPHVVPLWGIWLDDAFYCGGAPTTRWVRNIVLQPAVALHWEQADEVIIVEGTARECIPESQLAARLAAASAAKYAVSSDSSEAPEGLWCLQPQLVLAWTQFPDDATRWHFPEP